MTQPLINFIALAGIAVMLNAWAFSIPSHDPVVTSVLLSSTAQRANCSHVIKSEDIRFVKNCSIIAETGVQKIAAQTPIPLQTRKVEPPKAKAKKLTCRRGEHVWYYNAKKKRKMYKVRKVC